MYFLCLVVLAVRMVADVTETHVITRFGIQNLNKKVLSFNCFEPF